MNGDSIVQYGQAASGVYDDWHPPIMAILLHYVLRLGGGIGVITLAQVILGYVGIYLLSEEILHQSGITGKTVTYFPLVLVIALTTPITPLPFHLMAFIKDTWVDISFLWVAYLSLYIYRVRKETNKKTLWLFILLIGFMTMALLARHNTIVVLPLFMFILYLLSKHFISTHKFGIQGIGNCIAIVLAYFIITNQINNTYHVTKTHPERQVYAVECLGALVNNIDNKKYLPYMYSHLTPNYASAYIPGNVAPIMWWGPIKAVDSSFSRDDSQFVSQYYGLIKHAPLSVLKVKWAGFKYMMPSHIKYHWFHPALDSNRYGLKLNSTFQGPRSSWIRLTNILLANKWIGYVFGGHLLWILLDMLFILFVFIKKLSPNIIFSSLLFIPLLYCFSYLLASTDPDFRFVYPSSLLIQVILSTFLVALIAKKPNSLES